LWLLAGEVTADCSGSGIPEALWKSRWLISPTTSTYVRFLQVRMTPDAAALGRRTSRMLLRVAGTGSPDLLGAEMEGQDEDVKGMRQGRCVVVGPSVRGAGGQCPAWDPCRSFRSGAKPRTRKYSSKGGEPHRSPRRRPRSSTLDALPQHPSGPSHAHHTTAPS
jgi:hypothetical protein